MIDKYQNVLLIARFHKKILETKIPKVMLLMCSLTEKNEESKAVVAEVRKPSKIGRHSRIQKRQG